VASRAVRKKRRAAPAVDAATARSRAFWSGTLSFGLVSVPVYLYPATRRHRVALRMLGPDGTPLSRRYYSGGDGGDDREGGESGEEVPYQELVRGYELPSGEYVTVTDEELASLAPEKSREIDLRRFVPAEQVPPLFFDRPYFLTPAGESSKAYRLLAEVMETSGRAGIATFVMRGKEYLVAILAEGGILRAETLRFAAEVRTPESIGLPEKVKVERMRVKRFEKAIEGLEEDALDPEELTDRYTARVERLVAKKRKKGEDVVEAAPTGEGGEGPAGGGGDEDYEPADLMNVLKWSLRQAERGEKSSKKS
jgi:DNA end-binding protein Ku